MGDQDRSLVPVYGDDALAGFHQHGSWASKAHQSGTVSEVALASFVPLNGIHRVSYLTIDTEGHEAPVLVGLGLDEAHNAQKFPAFQFEVGGTWRDGDGRHNPKWWALPQAVEHISFHGYELYLIGNEGGLSLPTTHPLPIANSWGRGLGPPSAKRHQLKGGSGPPQLVTPTAGGGGGRWA